MVKIIFIDKKCYDFLVSTVLTTGETYSVLGGTRGTEQQTINI